MPGSTYFLAIFIILTCSGCAIWPNKVVRGDCVENGEIKILCSSRRASDYEAGYIFCPIRYQVGHDNYALPKKSIELAGKGYLYALAAAKVLHKENEEGDDHRFGDDPRLVHVPSLDKDNWTGFQASVFEIHDISTGKVSSVVVAFRGSDQTRDWILQNIGLPMQYNSARKLIFEIQSTEKYRSVPLIVTGASLGGGLASHVKRHRDTSSYVNEAWLFNPSIFDGILFTQPDEDTYLLYQKGEFLEGFRSILGTDYAVDKNVAAYDLIDSGAAYGHFRYSLLLQVLHAADVYHWCTTKGEDVSSPALRVLEKSNMRACDSEWLARSKSEGAEAIKRVTDRENRFSSCPLL